MRRTGLFLFSFVLFLNSITKVVQMEKAKWCACDLNPGPWNGRGTGIHWATGGPLNLRKSLPVVLSSYLPIFLPTSHCLSLSLSFSIYFYLLIYLSAYLSTLYVYVKNAVAGDVHADLLWIYIGCPLQEEFRHLESFPIGFCYWVIYRA